MEVQQHPFHPGTHVGSFSQAQELMKHGMRARRGAWPPGVTITMNRQTGDVWEYHHDNGTICVITAADVTGGDWICLPADSLAAHPH